MKKIFKPLTLLSLFAVGLSLASCGTTEPINPTTTTNPPVATSSINYNKDLLKFLEDGKLRIDFKLDGVTLKLDGNAITTGAVVDIPKTLNLTAEGKPSADFYCYIAIVNNSIVEYSVLDSILKDKIDEFLAEILKGATANANKAYIAITTERGGWTKNLDAKMDEGFQGKMNVVS